MRLFQLSPFHRKRFVRVIAFSLLAAGCSSPSADFRNQRRPPNSVVGAGMPGSPKGGDGSSDLKLKGTDLLAQSLYATLGPRKDVSSPDDEGRQTSLFDTYGANFGQTAGLRFGEVYPDSPSSAYLLALAILGNNAAKRCQEELAQGGASLCACDTPDAARAMLGRAYPFVDFSTPDNAALVAQFQAACQRDYVGAVSSVIASLAFAARS